MPRKKNNTKTNEKIDFKNWVWCLDNLSANQLSGHDKKPFTPIEIITFYDVIVEDGFSVTVKYDDYNGCMMATATCGKTGFHNSGLCLSARAEHAEDCLSILFYKYFTIAERNLQDLADKKPRGLRG